MATTNLGLPTITGNMSADAVRDINALAQAVDIGAAKASALTSHQADDVNHVRYAAATGTANTYAVTLNPAPTAYVEGMAVSVKININAAAASTLNVNGLGAKGIKKANGTDVTNLKANGIYTMRYDGVNFILQGEGGSGNAIASDLLSGKTASTDAGEIVGTIPSKGVQTYTPGTTNQTIASGQYLSGTQTISGDADLIASNIKNGINIFGVSGNLIPLTNERKWATGTATSGSTNTSYTYISGTTMGEYELVVTGLTFKPSTIIAKYNDGTYDYITIYESVGGGLYNPAVKTVQVNNSNSSVSTYNFKGDAPSVSVTATGFAIPAQKTNVTYTWLAIA